MIYSKIFELIKIFPRKHIKLASLILFLSILTMIVEIISVSLIAPLTSSMLTADFFADQNIVNKIVFDLFEKSNFENLLIFCLVIFAFFFILRVFSSLVLQLLNTLFSFKIFEFLNKKILKLYLLKKWSFFINKNTAEIMRDVLDETGLFRSSVILPITNIITEIFVFLGIISFLLIYETSTTILIISTFLIVGLSYRYFFKNKISTLASNRQFYSAKVNKNLLEIFKLIKEIKLSFRENFFYNNYSKNVTSYIQSNFSYNFISLIPRYLLELIVLMIFFSIIGYNYISNDDFIDFIPVLSVYLLAALRIMPGIVKILRSFQAIDWGSKSVDVIYDLVKSESKNPELENPENIKRLNFQKKIKLVDLNFNYKEKIILENFNFEINKYDVVGIIGKSGTGKTTLVNILIGLLSPTKGKILVDEVDISKNIKGWQKNLFLVQQDNFIFDDTIKKNITLGLNDEDINLRRYNECIQDAALKDFIKNLPNKDNTITGEDGIKISGGQKQRLSIARALYHNPEVLVLDEATSSLDLETEKEILSSLNNIKGKKTIFIISHRESSLKLCNKIIRL